MKSYIAEDHIVTIKGYSLATNNLEETMRSIRDNMYPDDILRDMLDRKDVDGIFNFLTDDMWEFFSIFYTSYRKNRDMDIAITSHEMYRINLRYISNNILLKSRRLWYGKITDDSLYILFKDKPSNRAYLCLFEFLHRRFPKVALYRDTLLALLKNLDSPVPEIPNLYNTIYYLGRHKTKTLEEAISKSNPVYDLYEEELNANNIKRSKNKMSMNVFYDNSVHRITIITEKLNTISKFKAYIRNI